MWKPFPELGHFSRNGRAVLIRLAERVLWVIQERKRHNTGTRGSGTWGGVAHGREGEGEVNEKADNYRALRVTEHRSFVSLGSYSVT
jgi:hypothetical protein